MGDQNLPLERSWWIGNIIFAILYGIELCMFFMSTFLFLNSSRPIRSKYFYIAFSGALLILITIAMACNLIFCQMMWIEHRDIEGGPAAYFNTNIAAWYNTLGTAADVAANILGDGLMLYRCYVFWSTCCIWVVVFPGLLFLASSTMGIITTVQSGRPGDDFFNGTTADFATSWLGLTITFNIVATSLIIGRLVSVIHGMRDILSRSRAQVYRGVIVLLVESALPFTLLGIGYLVTNMCDAPEALAFAGVWGAFVALSPQAIILHVAMASMWSKNPAPDDGTLIFQSKFGTTRDTL
ncbi:hypothetical protein DFH08DRAFT_1084189 [Mycena albidolilacea]|uniref:Uncharacterized protein n=1 Tax=Mycena albidolilacea TaxID=1033008 RepID=A0AAD6ZN08_9AGAR|nr:hypothetical protein DFH08DRAFT_1084189 [Mycena albidolilacea]